MSVSVTLKSFSKDSASLERFQLKMATGLSTLTIIVMPMTQFMIWMEKIFVESGKTLIFFRQITIFVLILFLNRKIFPDFSE